MNYYQNIEFILGFIVFGIILFIPINSANALSPAPFEYYQDDQYGFSIEYPLGWQVEEDHGETMDDKKMLVGFYPTYDARTFLGIMIDEDKPFEGMSDESILQSMIDEKKRWMCDEQYYDDHGDEQYYDDHGDEQYYDDHGDEQYYDDHGYFNCVDFKVEESKSFFIDGLKAYRVNIGVNIEYVCPDCNEKYFPNSEENKSSMLVIVDDKQTWFVMVFGEKSFSGELESGLFSQSTFRIISNSPPEPPEPPKYDLYVDEEYGFEIEHISTWSVEKRYEQWDDGMNLVNFYPEFDSINYNSFLGVMLADRDEFGYGLTDDEIFEKIIEYEREWCNGEFGGDGTDGSKCTLEVDSTKVLDVNGKKAYRVTLSKVMEYVCMACDFQTTDQTSKVKTIIQGVLDNEKIWGMMFSIEESNEIGLESGLHSLSTFKSYGIEPPEPPTPEYDLYVNEEYGFEMEYPKGWSIDRVNYFDDVDIQNKIVGFYPEFDGTSSYLEVLLFEDDYSHNEGLTDDEILQQFILDEKEWCENPFIDDKDEQYICKEFQIIESDIMTVNGMKAYGLISSWIQEFPKYNDSNEMKSAIMEIPVGDKTWLIILDSDVSHNDSFEHAANSLMTFKFTDLEVPGPEVPEVPGPVIPIIGDGTIMLSDYVMKLDRHSTKLLKVFGDVEDSHGGRISFELTSPTNESTIYTVIVTSSGHYEFTILLDRSYQSGIYSVKGIYEGKSIGTTSFEILGDIIIPDDTPINPTSEYAMVVNEEYGFEMEYPVEWIWSGMEQETDEGWLIGQFSLDEKHIMLKIYTDSDNLYIQEFSDDVIISKLIEEQRNECSSYSLTQTGFICRNFSVMGSGTWEQDNEKVFGIAYGFTKQTSQGVEQMIGMLNEYPAGHDVMKIHASTLYEPEFLREEIGYAMSTFKMFEPIVEVPGVEDNHSEFQQMVDMWDEESIRLEILSELMMNYSYLLNEQGMIQDAQRIQEQANEMYEKSEMFKKLSDFLRGALISPPV